MRVTARREDGLLAAAFVSGTSSRNTVAAPLQTVAAVSAPWRLRGARSPSRGLCALANMGLGGRAGIAIPRVGILLGTAVPSVTEEDNEMAKVLACRDVGVDCEYVACGTTEEEVMQKAIEHVRQEHGMTELTPEIEQKTRSVIHEEQVECR